MKARQHFYRLGQKAAAWKLGIAGVYFLCGVSPSRLPAWAFRWFNAGYLDQAGFWARR